MADLHPVRRLDRKDDLETFDSTEPELDNWLRDFAYSDQQARVSVTYVLPRGERIVGYYTLAPHAIDRREYPDVGRLGAGQPSGRKIPVFLLARLALHKDAHSTGLGGDLLKDALIRCVGASSEFGGRAVVVHAKHDKAASFYEHYGFSRLPENELHLYLLVKDIRKSLESSIAE